jgi:chromosome segregation ATPase
MATAVASHRRLTVPSSTMLDSHDAVQMKKVQQENQALKQKLARIQSDYEELQQDSKFHQAKVGELSEMLLKKSSWGGKQDQEALVQKTKENAELQVKLSQLQARLKHSDSQLEILNREKQENKRLLLEMSDIVRTLQSVQINYDVSSVNHDNTNASSYLGAQQNSIKKIKMKIEAIMSDRSLLVRRCKELEKESSQQEEKIKALESQFHALNSRNLVNKGGVAALEDDLATQPTIHVSTSYSISTKQSEAATMSPFHSPGQETNRGVDEDASMDSCMDHSILKLTQHHQAQMQRLKQENERVYEQLDSLKEQLRICKDEMEDAVIKRDEYKETLRDIITQYKELHAEHQAASEELKKLKEDVDTLANEEEEDDDEGPEGSIRSARSQKEAEMIPRLSDVLAAYSRAMDKISNLEHRLSAAQDKVNAASNKQDSGDKHYRDAVMRYKQMEQDRNHFQRMLDKAKEETRKAKAEAQKEREEAKHVRRRLTLYLQNKHGKGALVGFPSSKSSKVHPLSLPDLNSPGMSASSLLEERETLLAEKARLEKENQELTDFCQEMLKQAGA